METCNTCRFWGSADVRQHGGYDAYLPLDWNDETNYQDEADNVTHQFQVRACKSPLLLDWEHRPTQHNQAAVVDIDESGADLVTGPDFGCTNWEAR